MSTTGAHRSGAALVSLDDADGVAAAAGDDNREVRIAAANGSRR
jgi:hypothetical protein